MQGYPCADASAGARIRGAAEHSPSAPRSECIIIAAKPRLATTFSQKAPCGTPKRSGTVRASSKAAGTHAAHDGPQTVGQPRCDPLPRNPGKALAPTILVPLQAYRAAAAPTYRNGGPHGPTRDHVHLAPLLHCRQRARVRLARLRPLRLRRARRQRRRACQPGKGSQKGRPVLRERDHRDGERSGRHRGGPGREGRAHRVRRLGGRRPGLQGRGRVGGCLLYTSHRPQAVRWNRP